MKKLLILLVVLSTLVGSLMTTAVSARVQVGGDSTNSETLYLTAWPYLRLSPDVGAVGDWVKIRGVDWVPNEMVTVTFGDTQFLVMPDSSGALNLAIQVPPPSVHGPITITAQDNQGNDASTTFTKEDFVVYEYGHFAIHYTTNDQDMDCVQDIRDQYGNVRDEHDTEGNPIPNGIPDCVDIIAYEAELCWQVEIDQFGYLPPASASWFNKYHAYIRGQGCFILDGPGIDPGDTHVQISGNATDKDHVDSYYANLGIYDLKEGIGHELYHAIQCKYYATVPQATRSCLPGWIFEGSATWMAKEVSGFYSPPVLPANWSCDYLAETYKGLDPADCNGYFTYAGCLFFSFLADNNRIDFTGAGAKRDIMRMYWEEVSAHGDLDNKQNFDHALSNAPEGYNSFDEAFMAFTKANYFHDFWYLNWPSYLEVTSHLVDLSNASYAEVDSHSDGLNPLDHYGAEYFKIEAPQCQNVRIVFAEEDPRDRFFLLIYPEGDEYQECSLFFPHGQDEVTVKASNTVVIVGRLDDLLDNNVGNFRMQFSLAPNIDISPNQGCAGTIVTVEGCGFTPNTAVAISFGDIPTGVAFIASDGSFRSSFSVPVVSPGLWSVSATDGAGSSANATFAVEPCVTVSPNRGSPLTLVTLSGFSFPPSCSIQDITFNGMSVNYPSPIITDANGQFQCNIIVPPPPYSQIGRNQVVITACGVQAEAEFTVTPTFVVTPSSGMAGSEVTITGSYWTQGYSTSAVDLTFAGVYWHTTYADANGELNESGVATPSSATPGVNMVVGTDSFGNTASTTFTVINNTPVGEDTSVVAQDPKTGEDTPVTVTFSEVTRAGDTTAELSDVGPPPPEGLKLGTDPPTYFDIDTTAGYTPPVEICIDYSGMNVKNENNLKLMHWDGEKWKEIPTLIDTVNNIICGNVTSLSDFALMVPQWTVESLLPATEKNKAGRTMPIKFSLRVAASVDSAQPFIYNENLTIEIFATSNPGYILQTSTFGKGARDYRIADGGKLYITNFKTDKIEMEYMVRVSMDDVVIGSFTLKTVK